MKMILLWVTFLLFFSILTTAEPYATGDKQLDRWLINLDFKYGKSEKLKKDFLADLARTFKEKPERLDHFIEVFEWSVGEIAIGLAIAEQTKTTIKEMEPVFNQYRGNGWKSIAEALGAPLGSVWYKNAKKRIEEMAPKTDLERKSRTIYGKSKKKNEG